MHSFKDFGIKIETKSFEGEKIKIDRIQNKEITVEAFRIETSKYEKGNGKCLHVQITFDGAKRVFFTGSVNLMEQIQKVPKEKFPFKTTIVKDNERYEFT